MIKLMRSAVQSWAMKLLLMAIVVSFVSFYGFQMDSGTQSSGSVVEVNGESISRSEFQYRYQTLVNVYEQYGLLQDRSNEGMMRMLQENVIRALIEEEIQRQASVELGFVTSQATLRNDIKKQLFGDQPFDMDLYRNYLRGRLNTTRKKFEDSQARSQLASQFGELISTTAFVSEKEIRQTFEWRNSKINLEYLKLSIDELKGVLSNPSANDQDLKKYFEENQARYQEEETRRLEIASIRIEDLLTPTERDLEDTLTDYPSPEELKTSRYRASHILIKADKISKADAKKRSESIFKKIQSGASFEALARTESEDSSKTQSGDLGYFGPGKMVKPFEKAAFSGEVGKVLKPIESTFGYHIIKVTDRIEPGENSVERLRKELSFLWQRSVLSKSEESESFYQDAQARLNKIKTDVETGISLSEAAKKDSLVKFIESGWVQPGDEVKDVIDGPQISRTAQTMNQGDLSNPIRGFRSKSLYLFQVKEKRDALTPPLEKVRKKVREDFLQTARLNSLKIFAKAQLKRVRENQVNMLRLAKELNLQIKETGDFARTANGNVPGIGRSEDILKVAFLDDAENSLLKQTYSVEGKVYLVSLKKKTAPDWKLFDGQKSELQRIARTENSEYRQGKWVNHLCASAQIKSNLGELPARCGQRL